MNENHGSDLQVEKKETALLAMADPIADVIDKMVVSCDVVVRSNCRQPGRCTASVDFVAVIGRPPLTN